MSGKAIDNIKLLIGNMHIPEFAKWQQDNLREVEIVHYKEIADIAAAVAEFRKRYNIREKECFSNSGEFVLFFKDCEYVSGYNPEFFEHEWNSYKGIHFDLTDQIGSRNYFKKHNISYTPRRSNYPLFSVNCDGLMRLSAITWARASYHKEYWQHFVLKQHLEGFEPL